MYPKNEGRLMNRCFASCIGFCSIFVVPPLPAWAGASYSVNPQASVGLTDTKNGASPVYDSVGLSGVPSGDPPYGTLTTLGAATANPAMLESQGSTAVASAYYGIGGLTWYGTGNSSFNFDDVTVTAPSMSSPPTTIPITFNFVLNGSYSTSNALNNSPDGNYGGNVQSIASVQLNLTVNGSNFDGSFAANNNMNGVGAITTSSSNFGLLNTFGGSGSYPFTLGPLMVPVNTPFSFSASLGVSGSWQLEIEGTEGSEPNFSTSAMAIDSFMFGPNVATLPDGYTINSTEAGIVNNRLNVLPGDVNFDHVVNGLDIAEVSSNWLHTGAGAPGDANGDGVINGLDIALISSNWLRTSGGGAGSGTAVPEPSTLILAALGGLALVAHRRKLA